MAGFLWWSNTIDGTDGMNHGFSTPQPRIKGAGESCGKRSVNLICTGKHD